MAKILILEDDTPLAQEWREALEDAGYTTVLAFSGAEARAHLQNQTFDLVVADMLIHEHDELLSDGGLTVVGAARQLSSRKVPVIAVSGQTPIAGTPHVLEMARLVGANLTLEKPLSGAELVVEVGRLLLRPRT